MTSAFPQETVAKATTTINVWDAIGNSYEDNAPNFCGIMSVFDKHLDTIDADAAIMKAMGAKVTRVVTRWNILEPSRGNYNWSQSDTIFNALASQDITISTFLWTTPDWAIDQTAKDAATVALGGKKPINSPPEFYQDYYDTMAALVDRYNNTQTDRPQIPYWEIWNGPYLDIYWWYPDNGEQKYVELLEGAYNTIKSVDSKATVLVGGQPPGIRPFSDYVVENGNPFFDIYAYHSHGHVNQHISALKVNTERLNTFDTSGELINGWWCNETGFAYDVTNNLSQSIALIKKGSISRFGNLKNFMWFIFRNKEVTTGTSAESVDENGGLRPSVVAYNALVTLLKNTTPDIALFPNSSIGNFGYSFNRQYEKVLVLWNENKFNNTVDIVAPGVLTARQYNIFGAESEIPVTDGKLSVELTYTPTIIVLPAKDQDFDGIADFADNCPLAVNTDQLDTDTDGAGDTCDLDDDNDGLSDVLETALGTNTLLVDSDGDTLSDFFEVNYDGDPDNYIQNVDLNPLASDSDGDGFNDNIEVGIGANPLDNSDIPANGDINNDGTVNAADVLLATQITLGLKTPTTNEMLRGDVAPLIDGVPVPDAAFDSADLLLIQRKVFGLIRF